MATRSADSYTLKAMGHNVALCTLPGLVTLSAETDNAPIPEEARSQQRGATEGALTSHISPGVIRSSASVVAGPANLAASV